VGRGGNAYRDFVGKPKEWPLERNGRRWELKEWNGCSSAPCEGMWGNRNLTPLILNFCTR